MNDSLTLNVRVWNEAIPLLYEAIIGTTHHILIQTYFGLVCMLGDSCSVWREEEEV